LLSFNTNRWLALFPDGPAPFHFLVCSMPTAQVWHQRGWLNATPYADPFPLLQDVHVGSEVAGQAVGMAANATQTMNALDRSAGEINKVTDMIKMIALQTNLLALNATIEATSAGEAGKGFAVVASEVRALAQRSAEAAQEIKARVGAVTEHVRSGSELVHDTGESLQRIIAKVSGVGGVISAISETATQQSTGLSQINQAIASMDGMTQQNAAMVEETTAATESLAREVNMLAQSFASFRIEGDMAAARSEMQRRAA